MTYRNWCFTLNNFLLEEKSSILNYDKILYIVIGEEVGEGGTPHLQGYMELNTAVRITTLKKLNNRMHLEIRRGTRDQARNYCMKEKNYIEKGTWDRQGHRTDLCNVRNMALEGGMRAVSEMFNYQAIRVAEKYLTYNEEYRDFKPEIVWIYGVTGSGKSKLARELCGDDVFTKSEGSKWWDGYDRHEFVIIDDFRDSWWSLTYMLRLLDRYECRLEVKGGHRQMLAKKIVVTSIQPPIECYKGCGEDINQLVRRIDILTQMSQKSGGNTIPPTVEWIGE